ncbi:PP2C family protein-serine/threonine phosphatase [Coraliomargarita akajimensis]|uniref:Protein serine/threonine phosphatase n=1 Tax=Coraliomargarita akajimensis (strain DSM 45221 / IAM 15411 / JCM 23193 / KCTC 12865 / 04OKA010-24) TaxID=583355 RepID=D5EQE7_CORAD|nr:protein phosphatase 2C domain-containing protein [Coraliomargarita akajimensis]ADE55761.1 protein serine/threonine phosphatase [Coraliomargarita akajimensis DSM 45221]
MAEEAVAATERIVWSGITDVGRFRKNNEDAFLALTLDGEGVYRLGKYGEAPLSKQDYIFAVSDGMGGANAGEFASKIAVEKITRLFPRSFTTAASGIDPGFQDLLSELFDQIHAELTHLGFCYEELRGMGATLSLCWVRPGWVYFAHVGDSRIYHLPKDGGIQQVSHDHTHVGWMFREGKLTEHQARTHSGRNALQQVLGGKNQNLSPQFGAVAFEPGDRFLLCSDGLVEGLWDKGMDRLIRRPSPLHTGNPAERLVKEAVETDGRDNTTALVFEMLGSDADGEE